MEGISTLSEVGEAHADGGEEEGEDGGDPSVEDSSEEDSSEEDGDEDGEDDAIFDVVNGHIMTLLKDLNQLIEKLIAENTMEEVAATELKDLFAEVKEVGRL